MALQADAESADPQSSVAVYQQGLYPVVRQAACLGTVEVLAELAVGGVPSGHAAAQTAHPDQAGLVLGQRGHHVARDDASAHRLKARLHGQCTGPGAMDCQQRNQHVSCEFGQHEES